MISSWKTLVVGSLLGVAHGTYHNTTSSSSISTSCRASTTTVTVGGEYPTPCNPVTITPSAVTIYKQCGEKGAPACSTIYKQCGEGYGSPPCSTVVKQCGEYGAPACSTVIKQCGTGYGSPPCSTVTVPASASTITVISTQIVVSTQAGTG